MATSRKITGNSIVKLRLTTLRRVVTKTGTFVTKTLLANLGRVVRQLVMTLCMTRHVCNRVRVLLRPAFSLVISTVIPPLPDIMLLITSLPFTTRDLISVGLTLQVPKAPRTSSLLLPARMTPLRLFTDVTLWTGPTCLVRNARNNRLQSL